MAYHGEGLWITQPDFLDSPVSQVEISETVDQLDRLRSPWLNHECASKQLGGYSFGTYLPPLYTELSARLVAANIGLVQKALDRMGDVTGVEGPLFLLEVPPLTYFSAGTLDIAAFFRLIAAWVPCGFVLDIGHVWTIFRYAAQGKPSLERFLGEFLDGFPMERVVEIHIAGLASHDAVPADPDDAHIPSWIDNHAAPIPPVLFEMLEAVLAHKALCNLRGVALEVDTKPIDRIVQEFESATDRFSRSIEQRMRATSLCADPPPAVAMDFKEPTTEERATLRQAYDDYAKIVSGALEPCGAAWTEVAEHRAGLERYRTEYLPHEILHWGGEVTDMFPETCRTLALKAIPLHEFVAWWGSRSRPATGPYDFFLLKIDRFVGFIEERAPDCLDVAAREASLLRIGYAEASRDILRAPGAAA